MPTVKDVSDSAFGQNQTKMDVLNALIDDVTNARLPLAGLLRGSAVSDLASLADAAGASQAVTVTGAALGDFALGSASLDIQGMTVTAYVSAADTVTLRVQNESGGAIDLASVTWRAAVIPQGAFTAPAAISTTK